MGDTDCHPVKRITLSILSRLKTTRVPSLVTSGEGLLEKGTKSVIPLIIYFIIGGFSLSPGHLLAT